MSIAILSTSAGRGHISVMNALATEFYERQFNDVSTFPTFYEDLLVSNKIFSEFYNYLMVSSPQLCSKLGEVAAMIRPDLSEDFYAGCHDKIVELIQKDGLRAIVSTSHSINHAIIRVLDETKMAASIGFYVVVTDPFEPIAVGFNVKGAKKYYCASDAVKQILVKSGIDQDLVSRVSYPVHPKFLRKYAKREVDNITHELQLARDKKTILINCGAQGAYHCINYLKIIAESENDYQVLFVCGKNPGLYNLAKKYKQKIGRDNIQIFGFLENIQYVLAVSDVVITKPGANAFFESLYLQKPLIIDGVNGFLYQEKGVVDFLEKNKVGTILHDYENLLKSIDDLLEENVYDRIKTNIKALNLNNGAAEIVSDILYSESVTS